MRMVLLDPGFEDNNSHHATVNTQLVDAALQHQHSIVVLAASSYRPTDNASPLNRSTKSFFNTPCYTNQLRALAPEKEQVLAEQFSNELLKAEKQGSIRAGDALLIHSCFSFHLLGIAKWLSSTRCKFAGQLLICAMFYPGSMRIKHERELADFAWYRRYRLAFSYLHNVLGQRKNEQGTIQVKLASSCESFARAYQACSDLDISVHPAVNYTPTLSDASQSSSAVKQGQKRVILYLGNLKFDKGIQEMVNALPHLLPNMPQTQFFVQFNKHSPSASNFADLLDKIIKLDTEFENLKVHFEALSAKEYEQQLQISDALVLFYHQNDYKNRTSGLLWDAMRYPRLSLLCNQGIWAQAEYDKLGGSAIAFDASQPPSLLARLKKWASIEHAPLTLNDYGKSLNQPFADWCLAQLS